MKRFGLFALLLAFGVGVIGCSEATQNEASEAVQQTGEAIESAADDAANVTEGAIEGVKDAVDENTDEPEADKAE